MKKVVSLFIMFLLMLSMSVVSFAQSEDTAKASAKFDLTNPNKQVVHTLDADGNEVEMSVERINPIVSAKANYDLDYGDNTWKVYFKSISSEAEFYMDINIDNNGIATITDAYDEYYYIMPYNVTLAELSIVRDTETSSKPARAEYYFEGTLFTGTGKMNGWLRGDVKNMTLTTSFK